METCRGNNASTGIELPTLEPQPSPTKPNPTAQHTAAHRQCIPGRPRRVWCLRLALAAALVAATQAAGNCSAAPLARTSMHGCVPWAAVGPRPLPPPVPYLARLRPLAIQKS